MGRPTLADAARTGVAQGEVYRTLSAYRGLHEDETAAGVETRKSRYRDMSRNYYDLVTDFYEFGWGQSFHFAARRRGESLSESIVRHELHLAHRIGLRPGMRVLDVGCGIGGPMLNISRFTGASITGVNINAYQLGRGLNRAREPGPGSRLGFLKADFLQLPIGDEACDAAYAIEATCHAPDKVEAYAEVYRVLRPGGTFAGYEWCVTDSYDAERADHRLIKKQIEEGDALPDIASTVEVDGALRSAGFELVEGRDLARDCDPETPWYLALSGEELSWSGFPRTRLGRLLSHNAVRALERIGIVPQGATELSALLNRTADALVGGARLGIFTPLYFFAASKPKRGQDR
jgi:sterol 24-C-methyltransferase